MSRVGVAAKLRECPVESGVFGKKHIQKAGMNMRHQGQYKCSPFHQTEIVLADTPGIGRVAQGRRLGQCVQRHIRRLVVKVRFQTNVQQLLEPGQFGLKIGCVGFQGRSRRGGNARLPVYFFLLLCVVFFCFVLFCARNLCGDNRSCGGGC